MLNFHKKKQADVTISVIEVSREEAYRFGIMKTNESDQIIEFEEKPENPSSNLASMGIYIFKWNLLKKYFGKYKDAIDFGICNVNNVEVNRNVKLKNSIIMENTIIEGKTTLENVIIDKNVEIKSNARLSGNENYPLIIKKNVSM